MILYTITYQIVDFPVGTSPAYTYRSGLSLEEATELVNKLNKEQEDNGSSVYYVYKMKAYEL